MIRKQVLDHFSRGLVEQFRKFGDDYKEEVSVENFATNLIDLQLIPTTTIKHFVIQKEFEVLSQKETLD